MDGQWQPRGLVIIIASIIALIVIYHTGPIITDLARWIGRLFDIANLNIYDPRGFGAFVQLIMIAVFIGWAINRFRR